MTNKEALIKAVAIAKRMGYKISDDFFTSCDMEDKICDGVDKLYYNIIFDHSFCKSFWGDSLIEIDNRTDKDAKKSSVEEFYKKHHAFVADLVETIDGGDNALPSLMWTMSVIQLPLWQFHLAQLSWSSDPLNYIKGYLEGIDQEEIEKNETE